MDLTRRRFFQALAASALALGVPLPAGFPEQPMTATEVLLRREEWDRRLGSMMSRALATPQNNWFSLTRKQT